MDEVPAQPAQEAAETRAEAAKPAVDNEIAQRLSLLEKRMDGQEENLHRVLTMLVEWVENDVQSKESYINAGRAA